MPQVFVIQFYLKNLFPSELNTKLELNWCIPTSPRLGLDEITPELRRWEETIGILKIDICMERIIFTVRNGSIELKKKTYGFSYLLYYWRDLMIEKVFEDESDEEPEEEPDEEPEEEPDEEPEEEPDEEPENPVEESDTITEVLNNIQSILDDDVKQKVPEGVYLKPHE